MSSNLLLRVGDYAVTNKGLPNIKAGADVQITGVGIKDGTVQYSAALVSPDAKLVGLIGPYPARVFTFVSDCCTKDLHALIAYVGSQNLSEKVKQQIQSGDYDDERCADDLVRDVGAVPKKAKRSRPKTPKAVEAHVDQKYDNSHNWGYKGRVAQRAKDDLNDPKPDTEI